MSEARLRRSAARARRAYARLPQGPGLLFYCPAEIVREYARCLGVRQRTVRRWLGLRRDDPSYTARAVRVGGHEPVARALERRPVVFPDVFASEPCRTVAKPRNDDPPPGWQQRARDAVARSVFASWGRGMLLDSSGFCSKWGFGDGDLFDDLVWDAIDASGISPEGFHARTWIGQRALSRVLRDHLVPAMSAAGIAPEGVCWDNEALHNPFRATHLGPHGVDSYARTVGGAEAHDWPSHVDVEVPPGHIAAAVVEAMEAALAKHPRGAA